MELSKSACLFKPSVLTIRKQNWYVGFMFFSPIKIQIQMLMGGVTIAVQVLMTNEHSVASCFESLQLLSVQWGF